MLLKIQRFPLSFPVNDQGLSGLVLSSTGCRGDRCEGKTNQPFVVFLILRQLPIGNPFITWNSDT